ncbi:MAG: hypothetical protein JWQ95_4333 [Sphaerisporangium sp.]|jgi:hypothetical protein|nr:hypothetical protein [Sphaerisporangium sp.]
MSSDDLFKELKDAVGKLGDSIQNAGHHLIVQAAMGWAMRGDLDAARNALRGLPPDKLREVSAATAALTSLADEVLAEKPT